MRRRRSRIRRLDGGPDADPLHGVANFFDVGIVFALGFLLALMSSLGLQRLPTTSEAAGAGSPLEELRREATRLERLRMTPDEIGGEGVRLGTAYRLRSGEIVYVPDPSPGRPDRRRR